VQDRQLIFNARWAAAREDLFTLARYVEHGRWGWYINSAGKELIEKSLATGKSVIELALEELMPKPGSETVGVA
jgi:hypothetical protein